jgi:integrase
VSQRTAEAVKTRVEILNAAKIAGHAVDGDAAGWVANLDAALADKLASVGLIPRRASASLGVFLDFYIEGRCDVKFRTRLWYRQTRENLVVFFGTGKALHEISEGDAEDWRLYLIGKGYAEATVSRRCKYAKQFFSAAVRRRLVPANPFAVLKGGTQENRSRDYFVTREETQKVIDACPDAQWRLLFALSRYGGLRCPSEHLALRWGDVDWERSRLTIHSPKTERHEGGGRRQVPIFPELRPHLEEVWEQAEPGTEYVITRYRDSNANLRTQLERIIRRAGLEPWLKLFQNLGSTRETELAERFPMHVICAWIGNTRAVAAKHYLQVTDQHYTRALEALQNPVQQPSASGRKASHAEKQECVFAEENDALRDCTNVQVRLAGIEPATYGLGIH